MFFVFSRCVIGLGSGLVPIYIGEISPKVWRGVVGVFVQLQIAVGVLVAQVNYSVKANTLEYFYN